MQERSVFKKNINSNTILLIGYIAISILFTIPTVIYFAKGKIIYHFTEMFSYLFIRTDIQIWNLIDTLLYLLLFFTLFSLYFLILKNSKKIFKSTKKMFTFLAIIGLLFCIIIPSNSLDVYSYIGNGWLDSHYNENPYYTSVQQILDRDGADEMLGKVARIWRTETVIYGPAWSLICKALTFISFVKLINALYIFKLAALAVYLGCIYLIYKITKKKFFILAFALNPFILFEFLSNVHNDIYLAFFILLAIYFIKNKKNIALAVASLAIATAIKYLSILLLPFILVYALRNEELKIKIRKTILYGIEFILIIAALYIVYVRDFNVLAGIFIQQNKYGRSLALMLYNFLNGNENILSIVKIIGLGIFATSYIAIICKMFFNKRANKISFIKTMRIYQAFLLIFTFVLITNFNSWYVIWLFPTLIWQSAKNIRYTLYLSLGVLNSYAITYATKVDDESVGFIYIAITVVTVLVLAVIHESRKKIKEKMIKEE